jgi:hypothetical protein
MSEENKKYLNLLHKMKVALVFAVPVFIISMMEMLPNNPLLQVMDLKMWVGAIDNAYFRRFFVRLDVFYPGMEICVT